MSDLELEPRDRLHLSRRASASPHHARPQLHRAGPSRVEGIRAEAPLFGILVFVYKVESCGLG